MSRPSWFRVALATLALCGPLAAHALDLQLKDKIVLVTGSTSNIGYATARLFLKEGATVIVNSHQQAAVDEAVAKLEKETGRKPLAFTADVTNAQDIATARGLAEINAGTNVTVNSVLPGPTWDREGPRAKASLERSGESAF